MIRDNFPVRLTKSLLDRIMPLIRHRLIRDEHFHPWLRDHYPMSPDVVLLDAAEPFMTGSSCMARDFHHPEFHRLCALIGERVHLHRKQWEWVFILHHAFAGGVVRPGARGIVFGVGREPLPAVFAAAGMAITATDAPPDTRSATIWAGKAQHAAALAGMSSGTLDRATFDQRVSWHPCDMRAIGDGFPGHDLAWSSCALEHLGGLQPGLDFIVESVERTLRPGGIAIHTTELNLSSNDATVDTGDTVLYRRRDLEAVIARLEALGHHVQPLRIRPDSFVMDSFVDTPPYGRPHLRAVLLGHVATSVGLVIRKKG